MFRKLRPRCDALLGEAPHQVGVDDIGKFDRAALAKSIADKSRLGFRLDPLGSCGADLGVEFSELLVRQRRVVGTDQQVALGPVLLDLGFRLRHLLAQRVDLARKPLAGTTRLILLGAALKGQIGLRNRVCCLRGEIGIFRFEFERDDAGLVDRKRDQALVVALEHPFLRRLAHRILDHPDVNQKRLGERRPAQHRIELRTIAELERLDDVACKVA